MTHTPTTLPRHPRVASLVTKRPRLLAKLTVLTVMLALFVAVGMTGEAAAGFGGDPGP